MWRRAKPAVRMTEATGGGLRAGTRRTLLNGCRHTRLLRCGEVQMAAADRPQAPDDGRRGGPAGGKRLRRRRWAPPGSGPSAAAVPAVGVATVGLSPWYVQAGRGPPRRRRPEALIVAPPRRHRNGSRSPGVGDRGSDALRQRGGTAGAPLRPRRGPDRTRGTRFQTAADTARHAASALAALLDARHAGRPARPGAFARRRLTADQLAGPAYEN